MERDVVERARHGDRQAFEQLASDQLDRLYGSAALILHDHALAEDAVQETLIAAWRDLPRLRDPDRFGPWLHTVLVHRCLDAARHAHASPSRLPLPPWVADRFSLETDVAERDAVGRGFLRLAPRERAILVQRYFLGLTVPEIADAFRIPIGTAKSRLHAAEAAMRAAVDADSRTAFVGGAT